MKKIYILGICGSFMGSLALLAKNKGYKVDGCDFNAYPPMSKQLKTSGIYVHTGYDLSHLTEVNPDIVVVGNCMTRGNKIVEYILNNNIPYISGPEFISNFILKDKWVLGVSGTHGKTSTASMLSWILEYSGMKPGFLIGGMPLNFGVSARLGETPFFIIESDEYDTAFFDKRSKFVHYKPRTLLINNIEFDHADIFDNLESIQKQFHHLIRTIPSNGLIIAPNKKESINKLFNMGCWTPVDFFGDGALFDYEIVKSDGSIFNVTEKGKTVGTTTWNQKGLYNIQNAMGAILAARHVGVSISISCEALHYFKGIKKRMELLANINEVRIIDDFAHHPTAIKAGLSAWREHIKKTRKIKVIFEPRSNTMKSGIHKQQLPSAVDLADEVLWFSPKNIKWSIEEISKQTKIKSNVFYETSEIVKYIVKTASPFEDIIIMSNGSFDGLHKKLIEGLQNRV